jgi:poly-gamma-glutamate system protein
VLISSVGSSQWGANHPELTWPDMEAILHERGLFAARSVAISLGGVDDRAVGLSGRGKDLLRAAIERAGVTALTPQNYADSLDQRMALYREHAGDQEVAAYINVGGGTISVGTRLGKKMFKPGLNRAPPRGPTVDSVMARFANRGVPVIHLTHLDELAERYGLPRQPPSMRPVGEGTVFEHEVHSRLLAAVALLVIFASMMGLLRFDLGHRLLRTRILASAPNRPEPMV